jgi:hypothetical protein
LQSVILANSSNTQEMEKLAKILHSELLQRGDNVLKQLRSGSCQNNLINLEYQVGSPIRMMIDEQRRV